MIRLPDLPASNPQQQAPSLAAMQAPARALQDVSQGLATVGNALTSEAFRIQAIENGHTESKIRLGWNERYAQLNQDLTRETDPAAIPRRTQELLAELQGTIDDESLPPAVRNRLRLQFDEFSTRTTISAGERASSLAITRAKAAFQNEQNLAFRTNDRSLLENSVATAREAFALLPEHEDAIFDAFDNKVILDILDQEIAANPQRFLSLTTEQIQERYPELIIDEIKKAQGRAKQAHQQIRSEDFDEFIGRIDSLDDPQNRETTPQAIIQAIEENYNLTNQDKTRLKKAVNMQSGQGIDSEQINNAWDITFKLREKYTDPSISDADYAKLHTDTLAQITSMIPRDQQGHLRQELSYRSPANRRGGQAQNLPSNASNKSNAQHIINEHVKEFHEDAHLRATARGRLYTELDEFLQKNPGASYVETVEPFVLKLLGINAAQLDSLIPVPGITAPPNPISGAALQRAIQNGDMPGVLPNDEENANATRIPPFIAR